MYLLRSRYVNPNQDGGGGEGGGQKGSPCTSFFSVTSAKLKLAPEAF